MKKNSFHPTWIFILLLTISFCSPASAQDDGKKNTAYLNLTNPMLFGDHALIIGYERVVGKHQSFSISAGMMSLPKFGRGSGADSLSLQRNTNDKGIHIAGEYRFYLQKENKYEAPRGVYIGPYYSFNKFSRTNEWNLNTSTFEGKVNSDLKLMINTVGFEFGYQFVLWKRVALDLILFGPGLASYQFKTSLNTNLSAEDEALFFDKLNEYLKDKIPGYNLVIKEGDFKRSGSTNTTSFGFRYMVNLGFRF